MSGSKTPELECEDVARLYDDETNRWQMVAKKHVDDLLGGNDSTGELLEACRRQSEINKEIARKSLKPPMEIDGNYGPEDLNRDIAALYRHVDELRKDYRRERQEDEAVRMRALQPYMLEEGRGENFVWPLTWEETYGLTWDGISEYQIKQNRITGLYGMALHGAGSLGAAGMCRISKSACVVGLGVEGDQFVASAWTVWDGTKVHDSLLQQAIDQLLILEGIRKENA